MVAIITLAIWQNIGQEKKKKKKKKRVSVNLTYTQTTVVSTTEEHFVSEWVSEQVSK